MGKPVIKIEHLTKDYGNNRGVFDINLEINKGEVFGFIGINGAGKTTTIRNMMGFIKPTMGSVSIMGLDSWENSADIKNIVSYIPGEIAFPNLKTGTDFLKLQADYHHIKDYTYMNKLIKLLGLDPSANLKRMSKGMKQKTAIVASLIADKDILVLDEPTTGLDPLMRQVFIDLITTEKKKGKTVFMSSHIFTEIETVCDRAAIIKDGHIIDIVDINELKNGNLKTFTIKFKNISDLEKFSSEWNVRSINKKKLQCIFDIEINELDKLFTKLKKYDIQKLNEQHLTLEEYFTGVYRRENEK